MFAFLLILNWYTSSRHASLTRGVASAERASENGESRVCIEQRGSYAGMPHVVACMTRCSELFANSPLVLTSDSVMSSLRQSDIFPAPASIPGQCFVISGEQLPEHACNRC